MKNKLPDFGVEIKCPDGGCNGLPCKIDPSDGQGKVESNQGGIGAGNSAFCVVTVPKGSTAQIVAFSVGSGSGSDDSDEDEDEDEDDGEMGIKKVEESTTENAKPSTTVAETTTSEKPKTTSTTEEVTSTTKESTTKESTTEETTTKESTTSEVSTSSEETTSTSIESTTCETTTEESTTSIPTTSKVTTSSITTKKAVPTVKPGIFHENGTTTFTSAQVTEKPAATEAGSEAAPTQSKEGEAGRHQGNAAIAGLVVAVIAAACLF